MANPHPQHWKTRREFLQRNQFLQFHPIPDVKSPNQSINVLYLKPEWASAPSQGGPAAGNLHTPRRAHRPAARRAPEVGPAQSGARLSPPAPPRGRLRHPIGQRAAHGVRSEVIKCDCLWLLCAASAYAIVKLPGPCAFIPPVLGAT